VDVEAFEEAAEAARRSGEPAAYRAALDLYVGDLLPENLYEGWKENKRRELRRLRIDLLIELAWLYEERASRPSRHLVFALASEQTNEEAHVGLMRLYSVSGRDHLALRQYFTVKN
jgi:DNA-binding SARP family transcriptional activator